MQIRFAALCCACAALYFQPAIAQQQQVRANPANPDATAPSPQYQSSFDGYRPFRDEKLRPWREVNEEVERAGGHLGIFGGGAHAGHGATTAPPPARPGAPK